MEIGSKLEKDTANFAQLTEKVNKYNELSKCMSGILTTFEQRLGKLEETILPVYQKTEHLQKRQHNLESTLQSLDVVLSHYDVSQDVCNLIHRGPIEGSIHEFLNALDKLKVAMDYFLKTNSQSVELENVTSLFNNGCESLNNHYKALLKKHSSPLKPVELLDLIYIEDDSSNEDCISIKQLSPSTREELLIISNWLEHHLRRQYLQIYCEERSDVVFRSLQNLKDHQKSGSWGNEPLRPRTFARTEQKKTTSARLQHIFEKKANKLYLKATQTIENSTGFSLKKNSSHSDHLTVDEFSNNDQEMDKYIVLLLALQKLLVAERSLLKDVIPDNKHTEAFSKLASNSIDLVVKDAETITSRILRSIQRKEWTSALGIFSALKRVILLQPDIDKTCDPHQKEQLKRVLTKLQSTGSKALENFLDHVKGDSGTNIVGMSSSTLGYSNVPKDGTVHELTSNTIWFIEQLYEHYDVIGGILVTDVLVSSQLDSILIKKQNLSPEEKNKCLLAIYIKKILAELNLTIINKCEQYSDPAIKYLFRLNNINYILISLQRSNILEVLALAEPDCERSYLDIIRDLKSSYLKSWSKLIGNITPIEELPRPFQGKVKDKERAILKERFAGFNKDIEESCKQQRAISVPDVLLREGIKRDNIDHILPKYNLFYETYCNVQFSKNPEKYVKYTPAEIGVMLGNIFDDSVM